MSDRSKTEELSRPDEWLQEELKRSRRRILHGLAVGRPNARMLSRGSQPISSSLFGTPITGAEFICASGRSRSARGRIGKSDFMLERGRPIAGSAIVSPAAGACYFIRSTLPLLACSVCRNFALI